jgi:UDP-glucose 4-epimerase
MVRMQSPSTVILTGASGFIGQHVMRQFAEQQAGFMTLDIRAIEGGEAKGLSVRAADGTLHDFSEVRDCTLVHLAWCPPVRDTLRPHAQQVKLLAGLLEAYGDSIGRVIALGSAEEYGSRAGRLQEQDAMNSALSPYGWGKRSAQTLLETWCRLNGKAGLWLRPFTVYGEGQQSNMAVPYAVRQALKQEVAEFSAGTQQRDFIHVDDVARAIGLAAATSWTGFNIANLGTGTGTPLRDVLEQIAVLFDAKGLFRYGAHAMRPGEPDVQIAATERATELFGFTAEINLDEGLRRMQQAIGQQHGVS